MTNFFRCSVCGLTVIAEEMEFHQCKEVVDYRIDGDILWLSDGEKWYPRKLLAPRNKHPKFTPEDGTKPKIKLHTRSTRELLCDLFIIL